jgi:hypothetical protein
LVKGAIASTLLVMTAPTFAHHSYAGFDMKTTGTVKGTIIEWKWTNPHSFLHVDVVTADGKQEHWTFETSSPALLARVGLGRSTFKTGEKVEVVYHPSRDRPEMGALDSVARESGEKWSMVTGKLSVTTP